ncbi:MAG: diguanylate cyclase [Bacillota bacterium]
MSVIMFDINYFKKVNDTFEHEEGDIVLTHVARLTIKSLRPTDIIGRFSGEGIYYLYAR